MTNDALYHRLTQQLGQGTLSTSLDQEAWVFVVVNLVHALVSSRHGDWQSITAAMVQADTAARLQQIFNTVQGRYGGADFHLRRVTARCAAGSPSAPISFCYPQ
ncbi:hypothetical protein L248_0404 [Schleiferilactobacillus shenzhenensis LY-73]|uniref:Uncharacterized protein n=2 Tax=Schleiferilactobacillus shenzhenensis TaxID=1231337 RepID=U4TTI3_9LACO|nr:hypothetical protein L248_0404 [Schleiferilactobacillus shenzhenensis LY-73]